MITDSEDKPLDAKRYPEETEVYLVKNPKMALLSLEHLENYDPDGVVRPACTLSGKILQEFFSSVKNMDS